MQPRTASGTANQDQLNKSYGLVLAGNTSPGNGLTFDTNGYPLTYSTDNMTGIMIRIGSNANPYAQQYSWSGGSGTDLTITHNLGKVPFGYVITSQFGYGNIAWSSTTPPTTMAITLNTDTPTTDFTIWILC